MKVILFVSGGGGIMLIGHATDLEEASQLVKVLDARWDKYEATRGDGEDYFGDLDEEDPLRGYEGCDIYCDQNGQLAYELDCDGSGELGEPKWSPMKEGAS